MRTTSTILSGLVMTLAFVAACGTESPDPGPVRHPYSLSTLAMPFPSDHVTPEALESTFSEDILDQAPDSIRPTHALRNRAGWSPSTPVLFEAPYRIDERDLPVDGKGVLEIYDMDDPGAPPLPIRVSLSKAAERVASNGQAIDPPAEVHQVIQAFPRARFPFGHRLAAVLTTALAPADGTAPAARDVPGAYRGLVEELSDRGVAPDSVLSLTEFKTATEESTTGELFEMIDVVRSQPHPVTDLVVDHSPSAPRGIAARVRGQVRLTSFRSPADGMVDFEPGDIGTEDWTEFDLYLPHASKEGKVPVIIYGHGLGLGKSTAAAFAWINASHGIATIAIDYPNHGGRRSELQPGFFESFTTENVGHVAGMATQGVLDTHSVQQAVLTSLADLDVAPEHLPSNAWMGGYGEPDIDPERIYYMGTSLGGLVGGGYVGSAEHLDGAFLQVSGAGFVRALAHSVFYELLGFDEILPQGTSPSEAALMIAYMQNLLDPSDANNLIHNVRDPDVGGQVTPLTLQYGLQDSILHNDCSEAMAELAGLRQVEPVLRDLDHIGNTPDEDEPFGLVQGMFPIPPIEIFGIDLSIAQHGTFLGENARRAYERWLQSIQPES